MFVDRTLRSPDQLLNEPAGQANDAWTALARHCLDRLKLPRVAKGFAIHLFVRETKLGGGKAAPFVYRGRVTYQAHVGSNPMSVTFKV